MKVHAFPYLCQYQGKKLTNLGQFEKGKHMVFQIVLLQLQQNSHLFTDSLAIFISSSMNWLLMSSVFV